MPEIEGQEQWGGSPFLVADLAVAIGWQWRSREQGGPSFVLARRTRMGTLKVTDQFPLSGDGWAAAWQALAAASPQSAQRCHAALDHRVAAQAARAARAAEPAPLDWRAAARLIDPAELSGEHVITSGPELMSVFIGSYALPHATTVSPTGITWRGLLRRYRYRWGDVTAIHVNTRADDDTFFERRWDWQRPTVPRFRVELTLADGRHVQPAAPAAYWQEEKAFWAAASLILAYWNAYHAAA